MLSLSGRRKFFALSLITRAFFFLFQCELIVSGLWGIFYFNEIQGATTIFKWLLSATVTVLGILLLSYEHHEK